MFSSAVANKQLRSFWMSSSQRLQERLPIWSGFPLSVARDCFSEALTTFQMLLIESPAPTALKCKQMTTERPGKHKAYIWRPGNLLLAYLHPQSLTKLQNFPFFTVNVAGFRKYLCGLTVLSSFIGSWREMSKNSYFFCSGSRCMSTSKGMAFLCKHFSVQLLQ